MVLWVSIMLSVVVGAANGDMMLVAIGMLITVPIIIYGSTLFVKVIERFPNYSLCWGRYPWLGRCWHECGR